MKCDFKEREIKDREISKKVKAMLPTIVDIILNDSTLSSNITQKDIEDQCDWMYCSYLLFNHISKEVI